MIVLPNKVVIFSSLLLSLGIGGNSRSFSRYEEVKNFWLSADFPNECISNATVCDEAECAGFDEHIQAAGAGYYRYVTVDANGTKWGHQYYLCSCRSNTTWEFNSRFEFHSGDIVYAASICKINEVQFPFPEDSTESCNDLNIYGKYDTEEERESNKHACLRHCNEVLFDGFGLLDIPDNEFGVVGITSTSGKDHVCQCHWDNLTIEGCITPEDYYDSSGYTSEGPIINGKFWLVASAAMAIAAFS